MKMYKFVLSAVAVAAMFAFTGCEDIVNMEPDEVDFKKVTMYNVDGKGISGLNAVSGYGVSIMTGLSGVIKYADSTSVDFKVQNSNGRTVNSTIAGKIVTLNGTKFAPITKDEYDDVDMRKLKTLGDAATASSIDLSTHPYFITKLGNSRGYCLASGVINSGDVSGSATNTGSVNVDYFYFSDADVNR